MEGRLPARVQRQAPCRPSDALVRAMARHRTARSWLRFEPNSADPSRSFPRAANRPCRHGKALSLRFGPPSRGPGSGILRAETGGRVQVQNARERWEFGSQTTLRLTNPPELRGFLSTRKPPRFVGTAWWWTQSRETGLRRAMQEDVSLDVRGSCELRARCELDADAVAPNRSAEPRKRIVTAGLSERRPASGSRGGTGEPASRGQ